MADSVFTVANTSKDEFNIGSQRALFTGQYLGIMFNSMNLINDNSLNLIGYSLGTVVTFHMLITLFHLGCRSLVGDCCLFAAAFDKNELINNIYKIIGTQGVVQGKLLIFYTTRDSVLKGLFSIAKEGEQDAVGLGGIIEERILENLSARDPILKTKTRGELEVYARRKLEIIDMSNEVSSHADYGNLWKTCFAKSSFVNDNKCFN
jgi:hypothetical protein